MSPLLQVCLLQQLPPLGPCEPCLYSLGLDYSSATFKITNQAQPDISYAFALQAQESLQQIIILVDKEIVYLGTGLVSGNQAGIKLTVQSMPRNAVIYFFTIQSTDLGLYVQHQQSKNQKWIPISSFISAILLLLMFPLAKQRVQNQLQSFKERSFLFSILMYSQLLMTITSLQFVIMVLYVYFAQSFLTRCFCYFVLGNCFMLWMINCGFSFALIQKKMNQYLINDNMFKFGLQALVFVFGILTYPALIATFHKGMWFFYFNSFGLLMQLIISYNRRIKPNMRFTLIYAFSIFYLAFQSSQFPIANFHELSILQLFILFIYLSSLVAVSWILCRKLKHLEDTDSMFKEDSRVPSHQMQTIKSDIQLQSNK